MRGLELSLVEETPGAASRHGLIFTGHTVVVAEAGLCSRLK